MNICIKDKISKLPDKPGVYMFRGSDGVVLYIGKAKSLKKRVKSYFVGISVSVRTRKMTEQICDFEYILLKSEQEALLLEDRLVKEYRPKYNILLKDDKRFPLLKVTVQDAWPSIKIVRVRKDDGARYYGPYADGSAVRRVLKFIQKTFKLCRCNYANIKKNEHCLYYDIGECYAPCIRKISPMEYADVVEEVCLLLEGKSAELLKKLRSKMFHVSRQKNYEKAAKIRDVIYDLDAVVGTKIRKDIIKGRVYINTKAQQGIGDLFKLLKLSKKPERIEAFDVSNISGVEGVGSMVVFHKGVPYKSGYRRYKVKTVTGQNDYAMIQEIVHRRYSRQLREKGRIPDLILVDGGKGQLQAAKQILDRLGLGDVAIVGLAKRFEEIYIPGNKNPLKISKDSPGLLVLMHVRDEAHRFAVGYHRKLRAKRIKESILDDISGIGPVKKIKLLSKFGSIDRIRKATIDKVCEVKGINKKQAEHIKKQLNNKEDL